MTNEIPEKATQLERAILECAKAIDRLGDQIAAQEARERRVLDRLDELLDRELWVETFRADTHALDALSDL